MCIRDRFNAKHYKFYTFSTQDLRYISRVLKKNFKNWKTNLQKNCSKKYTKKLFCIFRRSCACTNREWPFFMKLIIIKVAKTNLALIRPDTTGTSEFLAPILRLNFNQHDGQEELKGVSGKRVEWTLNFSKEFASIPSDDRNEIHFWRL